MPENDDMDAPVTRRELREELAVTRRELREELAVTRQELRQELRKELAAWAKHIFEAVERSADAREQRLEQRLEQRIVTRLSAEIAQHAKATQEHTTTLIRALDDRYRDLPERVDRLERRVFRRRTR